MNILYSIKDFLYYNRYKIIGIVGVLFFFFYFKDYLLNMDQNETEKIVEIEEINKEEIKEEKVTVDIKGAVLNPGIYTLDNNKRVFDAITIAGGLLDNSDTENINMSLKLTDEMVIIVPFKEKKQNSVGDKEHLNNSNNIENDAKVSNSKNTNNEKVSINKANKEDLMTLEGIGETRALAIINYRKEHGNFKSISELQNVKVIGKSIFEKIKDNIEL